MKFRLGKKKIIYGIILLFILIFIAFIFKLLFFGNKDVYGDRCSDRTEYKITNKKFQEIKSKFKEIEEVNDVDVYNKLCTIKVIVNLKSDVELSVIQAKAKEILSLFSEKELKYYDFALYVTSDNKDSEIYPINVSKHNSREDFVW